jgi:hypothetical protein
MAGRRASFTPIPAVPQQGLSEAEFRTLNAIKENLELLTGARGSEAAAVLRGSVNITNIPEQQLTRTTAQGVGYTINDVNVPNYDDYVKLITDVQVLANDVALLRQLVLLLINQLRG